jgi:CRISPR-associated protein Cmr5
METRSQKYARAAYDRIMARKETPVEARYGALALSFPVMVLQSGLAQATGFLLAKGRDEHHALLDDLAGVLQQCGTVTLPNAHPARTGLHEYIIASDLATYQYLTRCVLEAAGWFKRYAQGILKADPTAGGD